MIINKFISIRFKTRNTYKRHLKTRHGKVLTTTGELLYLSEEDFRKVRTNRKKKNDINKEHVIDEGTIAAKTIMQYNNDDDQLEDTVTEEYIINENTAEGHKNWESNDAIQIIRNCFETYEVCPESHSNKTENAETEIPVDNKVSNKNNLPEEYMDEMQENLQQMQNASYNKLELAENEKNQIICHNDISQSELIYHDMNETPSYYKVAYNDLVNIKNENDVDLQENIELTEDQFKNSVELLEHTQGYCNDILNEPVDKHQNENSNKHIIFNQKDKKEDNASITNDKSYQQTQEISVTENLIDTNTSNPVNQSKQHLYIHNDSLTSIIVQNKCINIIPHQFKACQDQQNKSKAQVNKGHAFTLLNKHVQAVNIKQNGNQNTILLLTNDALQSSVLRINQNSTANNEIKE